VKTIPYRYRPSPGFVFLVAVAALLGLFFWWALSPPDLVTSWGAVTRVEADPGQALSAEDRAALENVRRLYPELSTKIGPEGKLLEESRADDPGGAEDDDGD
jgi:hypothetical protein